MRISVLHCAGRQVSLNPDYRFDALGFAALKKSITPYMAPWSVRATAGIPSSLARLTSFLDITETI